MKRISKLELTLRIIPCMALSDVLHSFEMRQCVVISETNISNRIPKCYIKGGRIKKHRRIPWLDLQDICWMSGDSCLAGRRMHQELDVKSQESCFQKMFSTLVSHRPLNSHNRVYKVVWEEAVPQTGSYSSYEINRPASKTTEQGNGHEWYQNLVKIHSCKEAQLNAATMENRMKVPQKN